MPYHNESIKIFKNLNSIKSTLEGGTNFKLGDVDIKIEGKDGIGGLIEEWFGVWAERNGFYIENPKKGNSGGSQEFPDYFIGKEKSLLEIKTYNADASPNFDIANFQSYCASVAKFPCRLDADYLIFSYKLNINLLKIHDIFLKKIWEITCASKRWPIKTQTKKDVIYNIRPSSFHSKKGKTHSFNSKDEFISALFKTEELYLNKDSENKLVYFENIGFHSSN